MVWEQAPDEFAALHRELELIRRWRPRLNVQGQPNGRRFTFVCLGRQPAPYAFLTRQPPRESLVHGPIRAGEKAREAVRCFNDAFGLRDCAQSQEIHFADQGDLFPVLRGAGCIRHEIGTCLGPCAGACTRLQYGRKVRAAQRFLDGRDGQVLDLLREEMGASSATQAYERAASLRDRWEALAWLHDQLEHVRRLRADGSFVYPVQGHHDGSLWYLIHNGRAVAAIRKPESKSTAVIAARRIELICRAEDAQRRLESAEHLNGILLVASWFRRYPDERSRVLLPEDALARCARINLA
jgi:excinuclease ABC subunit C